MKTNKSFKYWQWRIIIVSMIVYALYYFARKNFSIAMPGLSAEYGITNTSFGIVMAIGTMIYGVSRFLNGFVIERVSPKAFMAIGLVLCAVSNFMFGFGTDLSYMITGVHEGPQFVNMLISVMGVTIILNQYFQGCGYPPCARMLPSWIHPKELSTKMSIWNTSHSFGAILALGVCGLIMSNMGSNMTGDPEVVARITKNLSTTIAKWNEWDSTQQLDKVMQMAGHYGAWRWCFFIPALVCLCASILCFFGLKDSPQKAGFPAVVSTNGDKKESEKPSKEFLKYMVFKNKWVWMLAISNFFVYVLRLGVLDWGPKFLSEHFHMDIKGAALGVCAIEFIAIFGTILAGWLADKKFQGKSHRVCLCCMVGTVISFTIFAFVKLPVAAAITVLAMAAFFIYGPQALIGIGSANQATKDASATANGLAGLIGYLGGATVQILIGRVADLWGWSYVFYIFIGAGVIGALIFLLMWNAPRDGYDRARNFFENYEG